MTACLSAVMDSTIAPDEILVINDSSTDRTRELAARFHVRIIDIQSAKGPMPPRYEGLKSAQNELLVFIDADVIVENDTFQTLLTEMEDLSIRAATGTLRGSFKTGSICGDFKNEYMEYIFSKKPRNSDFLYGSIWAIHKEDMIILDNQKDPFGNLVSDSEIGMRLSDQKKKIILSHHVYVGHMKPYTLTGLLKNDFKISFCFTQLLLRRQSVISAVQQKSFSHVSLWQALSTQLPLPGLILFFSGIVLKNTHTLLTGVLCLMLFYFYWLDFLLRVKRRRGLRFALRAIQILPMSATAMAAGMMAGAFYNRPGKINRD